LNAQAILEATMRKHGIVMADIMDERPETHTFKWHGVFGKKLLVQIIGTVCGDQTEIFDSHKSRYALIADVTPAQSVEVELLWTAHSQQLKKEIDVLFLAYVHKQRLFPRDSKPNDAELTPEDEERLKRMSLMMLGMETLRVRRQLRAG